MTVSGAEEVKAALLRSDGGEENAAIEEIDADADVEGEKCEKVQGELGVKGAAVFAVFGARGRVAWGGRVPMMVPRYQPATALMAASLFPTCESVRGVSGKCVRGMRRSPPM